MENSGDKLIIRLRRYLDEMDKLIIDQLGIEFELYIFMYAEALKAILETIEHNTQESSRTKAEESYIAPLERSNIIAFIGGRGTGKTTAINEFDRLLDCFEAKRKVWGNALFGREMFSEVKRFYVLPPIDASVLGAKEDLIEVILASMYQEFRKEEKARRYKQEIFEKEISNEFDRAYRDYIDVARGEKALNLGETVLVKLNSVSNSLKTRVAFDRLIKDFLKYVCEEENAGEKTYLVITIDDLDMNPENGYKMLEQLHKYLENLRVIVLIAVKYEQIDMINQKHFVDCLIPEYGSTHLSVYHKFAEEAKRLSNDYLLKVLPLANRIYLPEKSQLYLDGDVSYKKSREKERPVKEFILGKIASKMNIFYDADGLKKHFCLPDTVRELVSYVAFLDSLSGMKEIEAQSNSGQEQVRQYDKNHERFNKDIENRMALQLLNDEQFKQYQLIMGRNIERRAEYTVNFIKAWINNKEYDSARSLLSDRVDENHYCYVDLLETLYYLGREDYEDKVLVHCILASFTSEMVREYYSYIYNDDTEKKQRAENRLKCFRGKTFGGRWFNEIIPRIVIGIGSEIVIGDRESFSSRCKKSYQEKNLGRPLGEIKLTWEDEQEGEETGKIEKIKGVMAEIVPYMECLSLFLYDFRDSEGRQIESKWRFKFDVGVTSGGRKIRLTISNEAQTAEFDFLGFIGRELEDGTGNYGRTLHRGIVDSLKHSMEDYLKEEDQKESIFRSLENVAKEKSIWADMDMDTDEKVPAEKVAFPFYNLDMSYNIMKRVKQKVKGSTGITSEKFCDYIRGIYGYMAQYLKKEEDYYKEFFENSDDSKRVPEFYSNFMNSPFIKAFGIIFLEDMATGKKIYEEQGGLLKDKSLMNDMLMEVIRGFTVNVISDFTSYDMAE